MTGTDLNHAYWRIAFNLGIITKNTYMRGLDDELKVVRLAALSTLGKGKDYNIIKDGVITKEVIKIGANEQMDSLYKAIRYTCYKYMYQVKKLLGKDFLCYKTDAIYYCDTKPNRLIVEEFFIKKDLLMKQLD
jgi:hypothetical protein